MQDVQNIPAPDINRIEDDGDFGNHSDLPDADIEPPTEEDPTAPDRFPGSAIEEPPAEPDDERQKLIV